MSTPSTTFTRLLSTLLPLLTLGLVLALPSLALADGHLAEPDAAYDYWLDHFGDWDRQDVEDAGYTVDEVCVSAEAEGLPADLGAMGYHAVNMDYATSGELKVEEPHVILLDDEGQVIGVEYEYPEVVDPAPEIAQIPLVFTPPHPGVDNEHMSLHVYFVGDEDERYGTWNRSVTCPAEDAGTMDHDDEQDEDSDDDSGSADEARDAAPPSHMPPTGWAELPGGSRGMLLVAMGLLLGLAVAGKVMSRRYE